MIVMPEFKSWEELTAAVSNEIPSILLNDVASVAEEIVRKHILSDIYGAYTPKDGGWFAGRRFETAYERRHILESSIHSRMESPTMMLTTSYATANQSLVPGYHFVNRYPGAFLQMLENGNMGIWTKGFPRPVISNAQKEIDRSSAIQRAIQRGVKRVFD